MKQLIYPTTPGLQAATRPRSSGLLMNNLIRCIAACSQEEEEEEYKKSEDTDGFTQITGLA